jgi:hypothetical protein
MSKRRKRIILLACGILALALGWIAMQEREPRYNGRTLSSWLAQYLPNESQQVSDADAREAATAVEAIGTNALPFLVEWLRFEPGALRKWTWRSVTKLPREIFLSRFVQDQVIASTPDLQSERAVRGFRILGPAGAPAIPDLLRLVNTPNAEFSAARSLYALGHIGPAALPALTKLIQDSHHPHRARAIEIVGYMSEWGVDVSSMRPVLLSYLNDTNHFVRSATTNTLLTIAPEVLTNAPAH